MSSDYSGILSAVLSSEGGSGGGTGNYGDWLKLFGKKTGHERRAARKEKRLGRAVKQLATLGHTAYQPPGAVASIAPPTRIYNVQPGAPSSTGTAAPSGAPTTSTGLPWLDSLINDLGLGAQLAVQILDWIRARKGSGGGGAFPPITLTVPPSGVPGPTIGDVMAQFLPAMTPTSGPGYISGAVMPSVNTGSIWGTLGSALGQLGMGALSQLGGGPMAMPGGAPITGIVPGGYTGPPTITTPRVMGARMPAIFVSPYGRPARHLGTPLAWSGDVAACKRLKRAYATIGRAIPHRSSRARGRRRPY